MTPFTSPSLAWAAAGPETLYFPNNLYVCCFRQAKPSALILPMVEENQAIVQLLADLRYRLCSSAISYLRPQAPPPFLRAKNS